MKNDYPSYYYDKYFSLKVSPLMWLILLFLMRPYWIFITSITTRSDRMAVINLFYPDRTSLILGALASLPAILLFYAMAKRRPGAPPIAKRLWNRGRLLLSVAALLNGAIAATPLWLSPGHRMTAYAWGQFAISFLIVVTVIRSRYIKDCFDDFPADNLSGKTTGKK